MTTVIELVENGPEVRLALSDTAGVAIAATGFVNARPVPGTRLWSLRPRSKVGAVAVAGVELHVAPKIPVDRVVFLLEHSRSGVRWREEPVRLAAADDLLHAVVAAFTRLAARALKPGLLQGYRTVEDALPVVRGRIRETDQLRRRYGMALPVEVRYDDFTPDTPENQLLHAAVTLAGRLPGLDHDLRHRLLRLDALLASVTPLAPRQPLPSWRPTRLNAPLHHALHLAEVICRNASFELTSAGLTVTGFVVDMAAVFEAFCCAQLIPRLQAAGGACRTQQRIHLDTDRAVAMKPDLIWYTPAGTPAAVIDAKYKAERPGGFPDADLYQLLAYCTALRLPVGHLVYARGNEAGRSTRVAGAPVTLRAHTLDLSQPPAALLAEMDRLATTIARDAGETARRTGEPGTRLEWRLRTDW